MGKGRGNLPDIGNVLHFRQIGNGIQRIINHVWIDLSLQGIKLQNPLVAFIFPDLGNQPVDTVGHGNNALRQLPDFILGTDRQGNPGNGLLAEAGNSGIQRPYISGIKEGQK